VCEYSIGVLMASSPAAVHLGRAQEGFTACAGERNEEESCAVCASV